MQPTNKVERHAKTILDDDVVAKGKEIPVAHLRKYNKLFKTGDQGLISPRQCARCTKSPQEDVLWYDWSHEQLYQVVTQ